MLSNEFLRNLRVQGDDIQSTPSEVVETVTFIDNGEGDMTDIPMPEPSVALYDGTANTELNAFLRRPTLIDTRTLSTATSVGLLGSAIEPWYLFLNNSAIKNKLQNYAFLRGKLCIKVIINATPFHFGLMRVAYEPTVPATISGLASKVRTNPSSSAVLVTPYSQMPGIWLHPADNSGGELCVPYFSPRNWLSLDLADNAKILGSLNYFVAAPLTVASASGSTTVTISTYAWMEDVSLCGSTAQLILQGKDEYDGKFSRPAATVAAVAGKLSAIPFLYPFAKATEIGASAVAGIAALFGYTNVPNIDPVNAVVPHSAPHLATAEISVPFQKLALDPKTEMSIDPAMLGLPNTDEMVISELVSRPSTLTLVPWITTDAVNDILFNAQVSPTLYNSYEILDSGAAVAGYRTYDTWLSYVSRLFNNWRGDIVFDFEVICTKFHKGRIKISWDPLQYSGLTVPDSNTVYNAILDIGESNCASFTVPYHQALAWMGVANTLTSTQWSTGADITNPGLNANGTLVVSVLTPLMSPVTPQTVYIKVDVRAAKNFEFNNPGKTIGNAAYNPSFFNVQGKDVVDISATSQVLGDEGTMHPHRFHQNYGAPIVSLRQLLHRMSLYDVTTPFSQNFTRFAWWTKYYNRFPPSFGYQTNGPVNANKVITAGTTACSFPKTHPITYVANMYGGYRGSVNFVANIESDNSQSVGHIRVCRATSSYSMSNQRGLISSSQNTGANSGNTTRFLSLGPNNGYAGSALTNTVTNGTVSWTLPDFNNYNFNYANSSNVNGSLATDGATTTCCELDLLIKQSAAGVITEPLTVSSYAGTGVDYTCLWAICCPTVDWYNYVPTVP